jgi:mannitol 2-dehydrogenase
MTLRVSRRNLAALGTRARIPAYDAQDLRAGILHIGVGNFHRAHQAVYLDDLFDNGVDRDWALIGAGVRADDDAMRRDLSDQDWLTTVVEQDVRRSDVRITASMVDFLPAGDSGAMLARLDDPAIRIVSLTITEGGYFMDPATQRFDAAHPDIRADAIALAGIENAPRSARPQTVFGLIVAALVRRRAAGIAPFTVLSCDNVQGNGEVAESAVAGVASLVSPALARWVRECVAFPSSMVDRITPATTDEHRALVRERFGIEDAWPVTTEPFTQWVIEDHFVHGRPAWERVGAQVTQNVEHYEKMKIRLLNGSHQVMCYVGMLLGYRYAPEAMADPQIERLLQKFMDDEVTPLLAPVPGIDLEDYKRTLRERFANPAIKDQLARIGTDGSSRIPEFVLPTLLEQLLQGGPTRIASFTVAAWFRYLAGKDDQGEEMPINDTMATSLREHALRGGADPRELLSLSELFGDVLPGYPPFVEEVSIALRSFHDRGARATLQDYLN